MRAEQEGINILDIALHGTKKSSSSVGFFLLFILLSEVLFFALRLATLGGIV